LRTKAGQRAKKTVTAKKRSPWFSLALGQHPDGIVPSLSHRGPRIVLLQNGVWATNTFYVIHFHQRARVHRKLAAISMLSSFSQLYGELAGQPMSQGGLKFTLEAIKQYPLMLPEGINASDVGRVLVEIDQFLRKGADGAARDAADRLILAGISSNEKALLGDFKDRHWSRRQSDGSKTVGLSQAASPENLVPA
jgi:cyanophycinase-like exopeptidase